MDWFKNDELFKEECLKGHAWERYVSHFLSLQGLDVVLGEQSLRESIAEAPSYSQEIDLVCEGVRIEIKSRNLLFHTPSDIRYNTLLVDTVSGWEAKEEKPRVIICISRVTGAMVWLSTLTQDKWRKKKRYDHVREIKDTFYECPVIYWSNIESLTRYLKLIKENNDNGSDPSERQSSDQT